MKKCGNRLICVYVCSKKYLKKWQIHLVIINLIMMKTLQNIWKHKREFQINIFMVIGIDKFQFTEQCAYAPDRNSLTECLIKDDQAHGTDPLFEPSAKGYIMIPWQDNISFLRRTLWQKWFNATAVFTRNTTEQKRSSKYRLSSQVFSLFCSLSWAT